MVESDPADAAVFDELLEGGLGCRRPAVRRIVQLDEELVLREEGLVDRFGVLNIVDGKVIANSLFGEPSLGGIHIGLMNSPRLGDGDDPELRLWTLRRGGTGHENQEQGEQPQAGGGFS
jgi:hypothetical protein